MTTTHTNIKRDLQRQFQPLFDSSPDGVYMWFWLDGEQMVCNERLAAMFGYTVEEWCAASNFLESFIDAADHDQYAWNCRNRVGTLAFPVTFRFRARHKDGSTFAAETDMIPLPFEGQAVSYHFVRRVGD